MNQVIHRHAFSLLYFTVVVFLFSFSAMVLAVDDQATALDSGLYSMAKVLLSLAVVIVMIFVFAWYAKKIPQLSAHSDKYIQTLGSLAVGARERVVLLQVGDEQLLIGVAPGRINVLSKLQNNVEVDRPVKQNKSFAEHLRTTLRTDA